MELHAKPGSVGVGQGLDAVGAGGDDALVATDLLDDLAVVLGQRCGLGQASEQRILTGGDRMVGGFAPLGQSAKPTAVAVC